MNSPLRQAILNKSAKVGVIGLGYVGLPLVRAFITPATGRWASTSIAKVERLLAGKSYIEHIPAAWIAEWIGGKVQPHHRHAAAGRGRRPVDLRAHAAVRSRDPAATSRPRPGRSPPCCGPAN